MTRDLRLVGWSGRQGKGRRQREQRRGRLRARPPARASPYAGPAGSGHVAQMLGSVARKLG